MQARSLFSAAIATVTLALSTAAMAGDDHRRHGGRDHGPRAERHVDRHIHHQGPRHVRRDVHRHVHRDLRIVHRQVHVHPAAQWHRGQYLPPQYRQGRYVVTRHQPYLYAPPRGHHWVQVNGEFLLVAAATGLIAHAILSH